MPTAQFKIKIVFFVVFMYASSESDVHCNEVASCVSDVHCNGVASCVAA